MFKTVDIGQLSTPDVHSQINSFWEANASTQRLVTWLLINTEQFSMSAAIKSKPKWSLLPITNYTDDPVSQWNVNAKEYSQQKVQQNVCRSTLILVLFSIEWQSGAIFLSQLLEPKQRSVTFYTQVKTALHNTHHLYHLKSNKVLGKWKTFQNYPLEED